MVRNVLGAVIAAAGAAGALWSPFHGWYDGRRGRDYRVVELFTPSGISGHGSGLLSSLFLAFLGAAAVALAGIVLRSRLLVAGAGAVVPGFTILWMVRQGQVHGSLAVESDGTGLGLGVALALAGGVLLLLGAVVMRGRRGRGRHVRGYSQPSSPYGTAARDEPDVPGPDPGGTEVPDTGEPDERAHGPKPPSWQRTSDERW
ncbi:hypothetical protein GCM10018793_00380 [Streptomyces sulfonofaciens]|uniref:Uncharacterized protein n=1 Tax=Streptomyces sulfonofaciens TaxID=68272 RepID=A0A919KQR9_9ACTN|nr:hypothetical protein [Streptomyces sulfonofaciens]GHH68893.1 hypothetical protein GCM10018793_00380 [Streptomyces sulfonofaciens]